MVSRYSVLFATVGTLDLNSDEQRDFYRAMEAFLAKHLNDRSN